MLRAYALYTSFTRRTFALTFSLLLFLEGLAWIICRSIFQTRTALSAPVDYGPLNIFSAALVLTDSSAIHMRSLVFRFAWIIKFAYLLFSASLSGIILVSGRVGGVHRIWVMVRLVFTGLWIYSCADDLIWWKEQSLEALPGIRHHSSSSGFSVQSRSAYSRSELESESESETGSDD
jgi:hypothetical protein